MRTDYETAGRCEGNLDDWDLAHSWHPFTQMSEYADQSPVHVERGEGCWLWDTEGKRYLDANASVWTNVHGHNDPDLNAALRRQLDQVAHSTYLGLSHPVGAELGRKLVELTPDGLERVVFSDNGSNAIEIALKLSFQYWQLVGQPKRRLVIGMSGGYHGDTFGTMAVGDSGGFHGRFAEWMFERRHFPAPRCIELSGEVIASDDSESLAALERMLEDESHSVAAVILEPWVQGAAGMRLQPRGFLKRVEALCRRFDVHLILDEVFVAFGRMGSMTVCEAEAVQPDFLCLAKGLSAGYLPLAATLTTERIYRAFLGDFASGRGFFHGHTFAGNPLAAAVSLRSIEKLESLIASGDLARTIERFGSMLADRFVNHPNVAQVRQRGLAAALDLCPAGHPDLGWPVNERQGLHVCLEARRRGLLLRPLLDSVLIVPPLIISGDEIDFLCDQLAASIKAVIGHESIS